MAISEPAAAPEREAGGAPTPITRYLLGAAVGALGVTGLTAAAVAGLGALVAYSAARARGVWGEGDPPEGCAEEVEFTSAEDNTRLRGWFFRAEAAQPAPTIVLCHGAWTGRRECLPLAVRLRDAGYHVLAFDFRAHGQSEGRFISVGHHEAKDVLGAVAYVKARPEVDPTRIGVVGFSMGAAASIQAAARCPDIAALVADSSYADFCDAVMFSFEKVGKLPSYPFAPIALQWARWLVNVDPAVLRPVDHVGRIGPRPLLIVHAEDDDIVPLRHARLLFQAAEEPKELWTTPGHHVGTRDLFPEAYYERLQAFFAEALRTPAAGSPAAGDGRQSLPRAA